MLCFSLSLALRSPAQRDQNFGIFFTQDKIFKKKKVAQNLIKSPFKSVKKLKTNYYLTNQFL